jgi:quinohemoprotein ethanol dehydrogenase
MTYDPEYNRIYVGTGNGGPRNAKLQPLAVGTTCFVFSRRA